MANGHNIMSKSAAAMPYTRTAPSPWFESDCAPAGTYNLATGFVELDLILPGAGWPVGALTEIYLERPGIGELQLLMPAAAALTQDAHRLAIIGPPCMPYTSALAARGVQLQHVLILRPQYPDEQFRNCEQVLNSGNCGMLLTWQDHIQEHKLQRLQLAAERSGTILVLYRSRRAQPYAGANLRLHVSRNDGLTVINVLKRSNGGSTLPVKLDLHGSLTRRPPVAPPYRLPAATMNCPSAH